MADVKLPKINTDNLGNDKYAKMIMDYLQKLDETLRYQFANLDDENMTTQFIKDLTVGNLLITNGENSIIGNPKEGFKMMKGQKEILSFDINTGKSTFGGDVIGGSLQSPNYVADVSGMLIDLLNSTISTPKTKILADGSIEAKKLSSVNGTYIVTIENGKVTTKSGAFNTYFDGDSISINGAFDFGYPYASMRAGVIDIGDYNGGMGNTFRADTTTGQYKIGDAFDTYNILHQGNYASYLNSVYQAKFSGATGTFVSADAKTVTVSNGIITSIV